MINEDKLITIKMDKVVLKMDPETEIIYVGKCYECGQLMTAEEKSYGHECEQRKQRISILWRPLYR